MSQEIFLSEKFFHHQHAPISRPPPEPNADRRRSGRSHPLHPQCCAMGVPGEAAPYVARNSTTACWRGRNHDVRARAHGRRSPLHPLCFATGVPGTCGLRLWQFNQPTASRNWIRLAQPNRLWPSNALPLRDHERASRNQHRATSNALPLRAVEHALPIRTSAEQPARQAPLHPQPVTLAASARCTSNATPLRDHERTPRIQRQQNHNAPGPLRSGAFTMQ